MTVNDLLLVLQHIKTKYDFSDMHLEIKNESTPNNEVDYHIEINNKIRIEFVYKEVQIKQDAFKNFGFVYLVPLK